MYFSRVSLVELATLVLMIALRYVRWDLSRGLRNYRPARGLMSCKLADVPRDRGLTRRYASSDLSPARLLHNRRFNHALVSLLDLLRQLVEFGRDNDRGWGVGNIE